MLRSAAALPPPLLATLSLLLLGASAAHAAGDAVEDWSPLEAGHGNWSAKQLKKNVKKLKSHDAVMVGFSGASCGNFCRQFEPIYAGFAAFLSAELPSIKFMRLDADEHKTTMAQYGVSTLPEIITIKKGYKASVPYTGVHSEWALRSFALKLAAPPIAQLSTEEDVNALLADNLNATIVTGFFRPEHRDSDEYDDWLEASKELSLRAVRTQTKTWCTTVFPSLKPPDHLPRQALDPHTYLRLTLRKCPRCFSQDILLADVDASLHATYRAKPYSWFGGKAKNASFAMPFYTKTDQFTKTGSGQT
jgi:hypothetical protein